LQYQRDAIDREVMHFAPKMKQFKHWQGAQKSDIGKVGTFD